MLIDTHCHLNLLGKSDFDRAMSEQEILDAGTFVRDAATHDVSCIVNVGTSLIESINCIHLASRYSQVFAAVGIHPNDTHEAWQDDLRALTHEITINPKIVAIGETGLDYHYPGYHKIRQMDAFKYQIELAIKYNKALIVHTRDAIDDTLTILSSYAHDLSRCVIHCYSENASYAQDIVKLGYLLGIGGAVTYPKNEYLRDVVRSVPLNHIILETDAPFLPPQVIRGKKNTPAQIQTIATYIAHLLNLPYEQVALVTTGAAQNLFQLPDELFAKRAS